MIYYKCQKDKNKKRREKMKYTEINGETFETVKSKYTKKAIQYLIEHYKGTELWQCYENPSAYKQGIYAEWKNWYHQTPNVWFFEIASYNTFQFTLHAILKDEKGDNIGIIDKNNKMR